MAAFIWSRLLWF